MENSSSPESLRRKQRNGYKDFWSERLSILDNYSPSVQREKPLPLWPRSDVHNFIASDPVHGPALKTTREAANFGLKGSVIGVVSTVGVAWKYSRSLHGIQSCLSTYWLQVKK